jgi:hypothetical protein
METDVAPGFDYVDDFGSLNDFQREIIESQ